MGYIKTKDGEIAAGVSRQEFNKALYIMRSTLQEYGDVKVKLKSCPVSAEDFNIEDGINTSLPVYKYNSKDIDKFRLRRFITDVSDRYKKIDALKNFITVYTKKPKDSGEWYVYIGVNRRGEKKIIKQAKKELGE